jgi:Raf kinase inhibitor-like YbhB/YbcL family protein
MTLMPRQETDGGIGSFLTYPQMLMSLKADAVNLQKGLAPKGSVQSVTDFGKPGFGGACPPKGDKPNRYIFTVYALKVEKLDLDEKALPALVGFMLNQQTISIVA